MNFLKNWVHRKGAMSAEKYFSSVIQSGLRLAEVASATQAGEADRITGLIHSAINLDYVQGLWSATSVEESDSFN
jgi:hypothetical protein